MKKCLVMLLAAALFVVAGCKKDDNDTKKMTFTSDLGGGAKTEINDHSMKWTTGDDININGETFACEIKDNGNRAEFTGKVVESPYNAYYPTSIWNEGKTILPSTQHYDGTNLSGVSPMYANSTNTTLVFHNICVLVKLDLKGTGTVKAITASAEKPLSGEFIIAGNETDGYYAVVSQPRDGAATVTLDCGEEGITLEAENTKAFYIALPQGEYTDLKFTVSNGTVGKEVTLENNNLVAGKLYGEIEKEIEFVTVPVESVSVAPETLSLEVGATQQLTATILPDDATNKNVTWSSDNTSVATVAADGTVTAIAAGTTTITATSVADNTKSASCIVTVTVPVPEGALSGVFTIDEYGRQVRFSKGNLQYRAIGGAAGNASSSADLKNSVGGTWRFAVNQYDICGDNNTQISATYDGWFDLFPWGTSGWNHNNTQYFPWSQLTSAGSNFYAYGDQNKSLDDGVNIAGFGCNMADWGYNTIYSDATPTTGWRTLGSDEWLTLIGRTKDGNKLYGLATVNGQQGLIILPDDWNCPDGLSFTYGAYAYATNSYSVSDWTKMQNAGAVFLPKAGMRRSTTYPYSSSSITEDVGLYWTTTNGKNYFYFQPKNTNTVNVNDMLEYYGISVRLVKDVINGFNGGNANDFDTNDNW